MGPWSAEPKPSAKVSARAPAGRELTIGILFAVILAFGAASIWINRYELGQVGGVPVRMNRFTGQVIGCVARGCFAIIPAGEPPLGKIEVVATPAAPPAGAEALNAEASHGQLSLQPPMQTAGNAAAPAKPPASGK